jgi:hypothetical protein
MDVRSRHWNFAKRIPLGNTLWDATRFTKTLTVAIPGEIVYNNSVAKLLALFYPSGGQAKTPKVYENNSENHDYCLSIHQGLVSTRRLGT